LSLFPFLPSKLCAQPDVTLLLSLVGAEAAAPSYVSAVFLVTSCQVFQCYFVKYQRGWGKTL